jgi:hypothetical protein
MERRTKVIIVAMITVVIALLLLFLADRVSFFTGKAIVGPSTEFVECLNEKGFVLLGFNGNAFVDAQRKIFGEFAENVSYIDCSVSSFECIGAVIYPSWKTSEGVISGGLSLGVLSGISGCKL